MRRVFLDENVEASLELALSGFEVQSIAKLGMKGLANGAFLRWLAANGFEVLVAKDRSIPSQNPLRKIGIGVVIIRGRGELAARFIEFPDRLREAVATVSPGESIDVLVP